MNHYLVHHLLEQGGCEPSRPALIEGGRTIDYAAFGARVEAVARALRAAGLRRGDRVGVLVQKGVEECAALLGTSRADGVMVPVNPALRPQQVQHILNDCGARVLISQERLLTPLEPGLRHLDCLGAVLTLDGESGEIARGIPQIPLNEAAAGAAIATNAAIGEDLAAILYTSGSTGLPKGVMLSHCNLLAGTRIVRSYLGITPAERILSILPLSFDYGLNQLLTALEQGACLLPFTFRFGDEIVAALAEHAITGLAGVPSLWAILTRAAPSLATTALPHLRYITNSGGAVPTETVRLLRERLPLTDIYLMYGLTEAFRSTYLPPEEIERRPNSIGKAIPECEVFLVDDSGLPVPVGQPGILVHRGPTVSLGYWNRPDDTAKVLRPNPLRPAAAGGETVCFSGDVVRQDEEGYFYFVGRRDGMIKSSGYRISPTEVEDVLMSTGLLRQVAVIGLPDSVAGQRVHAVAVASAPDTDPRAVLAFCTKRLASFMVPRSIEFVDALPASPNGKVDYNALVESRSAHAA